MGTHHGIDYVEIPVLDVETSKRFYAAAFGWEFTDYGPGYSGIRAAGGGEMGGLAQADEVRPGGPLVVLHSDDLEGSLAQVESAGGHVVAPPYTFPGGRRFELTDPNGHRFAVWSER